MPRCPACDAEFEVDDDDEAELDVAYCPACDEPVNLRPGADRGRPGMVVVVMLFLQLPPAVVAGGGAAYPGAWPLVLGAGATLPLFAGLAYALWRGAAAGWWLALGVAAVAAAAGVAVVAYGVVQMNGKAMFAWIGGLITAAAGILVIVYGVVLAAFALQRSVREWCRR